MRVMPKKSAFSAFTGKETMTDSLRYYQVLRGGGCRPHDRLLPSLTSSYQSSWVRRGYSIDHERWAQSRITLADDAGSEESAFPSEKCEAGKSILCTSTVSFRSWFLGMHPSIQWVRNRGQVSSAQRSWGRMIFYYEQVLLSLRSSWWNYNDHRNMWPLRLLPVRYIMINIPVVVTMAAACCPDLHRFLCRLMMGGVVLLYITVPVGRTQEGMLLPADVGDARNSTRFRLISCLQSLLVGGTGTNHRATYTIRVACVLD